MKEVLREITRLDMIFDNKELLKEFYKLNIRDIGDLIKCPFSVFMKNPIIMKYWNDIIPVIMKMKKPSM